MDDVKTARALGWASIGIGLTEIAATDWLEETLGLDEHDTLIKGLGVREALAGVAILTQRRPSPQLTAGVWSRVAGDAMDLALLGAAARETRRPQGLAIATAMVLGITCLDVLCALRLQRRQRQVAGIFGQDESFGGRLGKLRD